MWPMCALAEGLYIWLLRTRPKSAVGQERARTLPLKQETTSVLICGGNPVVGKALKLLLRSIGYKASYLPRLASDKPDVLDGAQLLLCAGRVGAEQREASASFESERARVGIPVLELVSSIEEAQNGKENLVPWPCRVEELKRRIDDTLLNRSRPR